MVLQNDFSTGTEGVHEHEIEDRAGRTETISYPFPKN